MALAPATTSGEFAAPAPGRLRDFTLPGRAVPLAVFIAMLAGIYLLFAQDGVFALLGAGLLRLLLELCVAYLVAFALLAGLARVMGSNPPWRYVLAVALAGAALGGCAAALIAFAPDWAEVLSKSPRMVVHEWLLGTTLSALLVALPLASAAARQRERAGFEAQRQQLHDRLELLNARIEPHFLMNTLANLRYLVRTDAPRAGEMLDHLADFLQDALDRSRDPDSTLGHELHLVESYLAIMRIRMGDKLRFGIEVPQSLHEVRFPALLLQTLVENSITHGIGPADQPALVWIRAREEYRHIVLAVGDDGVGFDAQGRPGQGMGLRNVRDRLEAFFHGRASFTIGSAPGGGTEALFVIPRGGQ